MCVTLPIFINTVPFPNNTNMNNFPNLVTLFLAKIVLRRIYYRAKESVVFVYKYQFNKQ